MPSVKWEEANAIHALRVGLGALPPGREAGSLSSVRRDLLSRGERTVLAVRAVLAAAAVPSPSRPGRLTSVGTVERFMEARCARFDLIRSQFNLKR
jgi:hypothetical protein